MYNPFEVINDKLDNLEKMISELQSKPENKISTEIIDRKELCKRLAITEPTAIRWERKGKIPFFRIGSNIRYNWQSVVNTLEKP